jgi:hypothetical protein
LVRVHEFEEDPFLLADQAVAFARMSRSICSWRNSAAYGGWDLDIVDSFLPNNEVSTKVGQLQYYEIRVDKEKRKYRLSNTGYGRALLLKPLENKEQMVKQG